MKNHISRIGATLLLTATATLATSVSVLAQDGTDTEAQTEELPPGDESQAQDEPVAEPQTADEPVPELFETENPVQPAQPASTGSLLNTAFEGQYAAFSGFSNALVAPEWLPWWVGRRSADALWANARPTFVSTASPTHSGAASQRYHTEFSTYRSGLLQRVDGVNRGDIFEFKVWVRTWSSNQDNPCCSLESGLVALKAGIDPTGGGNPFGSAVVWSDTIRSDDTWSELSVNATAVSDSVTVFVSSAPKFPVKHNDVYVDDASLSVIGNEPLPPAFVVDPSAIEDPLAVSEPFEADSTIVSGPLIYSIQAGDTLSEIASLFDISVEDLADANGLQEDSPIFVAGQLVIPGLDFVAPSTVASYTMQPDDTFEAVAIAFNTNIYTLAQLNGIVNYQSIEAGTEILVPINSDTMPQSSEFTEHLVQSDETLSTIAALYDVSPQTIAALNNLEANAELTPGQILLIP